MDIGADDIEHADHDGSAPPDQVYRYFSMILDEFPDTNLHVTRGWGSANVLAALQAGITIFEGTLDGIGVNLVLELGTLMERTVGRRLRSESILNGRIPKTPREEYRRPNLAGLKQKIGERPGQILPDGWS